ncbi:MAG: DegT/DnrJ/EryC1/StrS family aminotransferase, partial [Verrucomicrobiota bacterium]
TMSWGASCWRSLTVGIILTSIYANEKSFLVMPDDITFLDLGLQIAQEREAIGIAIDRVLESGVLMNGVELGEFERELAEWHGGDEVEVVGVASGTSAIGLLMRAAGIGAGDEVIVPAFSCPATWFGVADAGAVPVAVDVEFGSRLIDPERVSAAVTDRTRAVLAVHLYGQCCAMDSLRAVCVRHGLRLFVDGAQSIGIRSGGSRVAALGDGAAVSFYPTKNLGALDDAGAVLTCDAALAERVRSLREYGRDGAGCYRLKGTNGRMGEMQAAVLRFRLGTLEEGNARRETLARRYLEGLAGLEEFGVSLPGNESASVWHLFVMSIAGREKLRERLKTEGIGTAVHYPVSMEDMECFRDVGGGDCEWARRLADEVVSLPLHPRLAVGDLERICDVVWEEVRKLSAA